MVFRIRFARNEWPSSTSSSKHSWYKWDMHLVSSVSYISRIFVNNCILFLGPLYNTLSPRHIFSSFLLLVGLSYLCCLGVVWPACADHCSVAVHKLNWARSAGRGGQLPAWGAAPLSGNLLSLLRWIRWDNVLELGSASQPSALLMVGWKRIAVLVQRPGDKFTACVGGLGSFELHRRLLVMNLAPVAWRSFLQCIPAGVAVGWLGAEAQPVAGYLGSQVSAGCVDLS